MQEQWHNSSLNVESWQNTEDLYKEQYKLLYIQISQL